MNAVGVIPSRYGSTRFPGKSLVKLCGKPLVQWVYERTCRAKRLSSVVVATDDDRIAAAVKEFGGDVVMTSDRHPSGTDRAAEAISRLGADIVVNIQGDEPLIDPDLIDELVNVLSSDDSWDMATAAVKIADTADVAKSSVVKVVCDEMDRAMYFSRSVIPFDRDDSYNDRDSIYWRHLGIYAYRAEFLDRLVNTPECTTEKAEKLEQLRALHIGARMKVVRRENDIGIGVDVPEDVERAEAALRAVVGLEQGG